MKRINWKKRRRWEDRITILWMVLCMVLLVYAAFIIFEPCMQHILQVYPRAPTR